MSELTEEEMLSLQLSAQEDIDTLDNRRKKLNTYFDRLNTFLTLDELNRTMKGRIELINKCNADYELARCIGEDDILQSLVDETERHRRILTKLIQFRNRYLQFISEITTDYINFTNEYNLT